MKIRLIGNLLTNINLGSINIINEFLNIEDEVIIKAKFLIKEFLSFSSLFDSKINSPDIPIVFKVVFFVQEEFPILKFAEFEFIFIHEIDFGKSLFVIFSLKSFSFIDLSFINISLSVLLFIM